MCGIAGALDLTGIREYPLQRLKSMTDAIQHRGPDDEHHYEEPGLSMGARRLSIVDITKGRQPISNSKKDIWTAFNGELFDYKELRQRLIARGHQLTTECDTELWVHLYEDHRENMFAEAKGQFAVSLWDKNHKTLILGRDRMGICPLYYTIQDGWLLWASEMKALFASGLVEPKPDVKGIDYLFNFFCAPSKRTYFENIQLIPPGHFLKIKDGQLNLFRYWDLDFPDANDERIVKNPTTLVEEFEALLQSAVAKRLRCDVPVVSYLSGGLDSTMILGLSNRQLNHHNTPAFTIGLDHAGPDERAQSKQSADLLGSHLTTLTLNQAKMVEAFPELIKTAEGPILDTSCAALMLLAEEVNRQGYKVALTGEGADEALAGYYWFKVQKMGGWFGSSISKAFKNIFRHTIYSSARSRGNPIPDAAVNGVRPAQQHMYELVGLARERLYSDAMWSSLAEHDPYEDLDVHHQKMSRWHPLNQSLYVGYKVMLPGLLMNSKGDRVAMRSSVEMRYPFLDEEVIRFCASIHPKYKLKGMTEKWLLRQVAAKILPPEIAKRPKTMFRANLSQLFLQEARPNWVDQLLSVESLQRTGYFDPVSVQRERQLQLTLPSFLPSRLVVDAALTCVISTQLWHHLFFGGGLCELPALSFKTTNL